MSVAAFSC